MARQVHSLPLLAIGAVVAAALLLARGTPAQPIAAAPERVEWEYGVLLRPGSAGGWRAAGENLSATKAYTLYREMGGSEPELQFDNSDLLSLLGQQGWELVAVVAEERGQSFYMKRPAQ